MGKGPEQTFFQRRHTNGQQAHEKVIHIINYQGNANQNHNEVSLHIRMPLTIKKSDNKCSQRCEEERTLVYCWWECKLVLSHRKQYSDSSRNRTSIRFCNPNSGYTTKGNKSHCFIQVSVLLCSLQHTHYSQDMETT